MIRRYVIGEVVRPFVAWTALFVVLFFILAFFRGVDVLLGSSVSLGDLMWFLLALLPQLLVQAIPVSYLLGIFIGFGRLSDDGELRAMQALGISPHRLLVGPVLVAMLVSIGLGVLSSTALPWGQTMVRLTVNEIIRRNLTGDVKSGVFHEEVTGLTLYVEEAKKTGAWRHVLMHDERDPERPMLIVANAGHVGGSVRSDEIVFDLQDGAIHQSSTLSDRHTLVEFERSTIRTSVGDTIRRQNQFQTLRDEHSPIELIEGARSARERGEDPRRWHVSLSWRIGQMLMPLALALIGVPLAMLRRGARAWGPMMATLAYISYFFLARWASDLGEAGRLSVFLSGQLPNLVFFAAGMAALVFVVRRGTA